MMDHEARKWMWISSIAAAIVPGISIAAGQAGWVGPNPATYFGLGMVAMLAIVGGIYGGRDAMRISRRQTRRYISTLSSSS